MHCFKAQAQVSEKGIPESFRMEQKSEVLIPEMKLDSVRIAKRLREDQNLRIDNRYGIVQSCEINIKESGIRTEIQGNGTIWYYIWPEWPEIVFKTIQGYAVFQSV